METSELQIVAKMDPIPHSVDLNDLPEEILLAILGQIDVTDYRTFRALSLTNQHLYNLSISHLYQRFPGRAPERFLRTIAMPHPNGRPVLASHIKSVIWHQDDRTFSALQDCLSWRLRHTIATRLRNFNLNLTTGDSIDLPSRFINSRSESELQCAYLELFLFFTQKIERLVVLEIPQWVDNPYCFETVAANPTYFMHLKSITFHGPLYLANVVHLLLLPSLRTLELTHVQSGDGFYRQHPETIRSMLSRLAAGSSLEHLILRDSHFYMSNLTPLFDAFKALKSFTYQHLITSRGAFDYQQLARLLLTQKDSLEFLSIHEEGSDMHEDVLPLLRAAKPLTNLRTLDILPFDFLLYHQLRDPLEPLPDTTGFIANLPASLEVLNFRFTRSAERGDTTLLADQLSTMAILLPPLAAAMKIHGTRLREISVMGWPPHLGIFPSKFATLQKSFADAGVRFVSVSAEYYEPDVFEVCEDVEPEWMVVRKNGSFGGDHLEHVRHCV